MADDLERLKETQIVQSEILNRIEIAVERLVSRVDAFVGATDKRVLEVEAQLSDHEARLARMDAFFTWFQEWIKGQTPGNGHES